MTTKTKTTPASVTTAAAYTMPARELSAMFKRAAHARNHDATRYALTGYFLELSPQGLTVTCADGFRLYTTTHGTPAKDTLNATIGTWYFDKAIEEAYKKTHKAKESAIKEIQRQLKATQKATDEQIFSAIDKQDPATVEMTNAGLMINGHALPTIPHKFPDYHYVIPSATRPGPVINLSPENQAIVVSACKAAKKLDQAGTPIIYMTLYPENNRVVLTYEIRTKDDNHGAGRYEMTTPQMQTSKSGPILFSYNAAYMLDTIQSGINTALFLGNPAMPLLAVNDNGRAVIMPMHIPNATPAPLTIYEPTENAPVIQEAINENIRFTREYCNGKTDSPDAPCAATNHLAILTTRPPLANCKTQEEAAAKARAAFTPPTPRENARILTATAPAYLAQPYESGAEITIQATASSPATPAQVDNAPAPVQMTIPPEAYTITPTRRPAETNNPCPTCSNRHGCATPCPTKRPPQPAQEPAPMPTPAPTPQPAPAPAQTPPATTPAAGPRAFFVALTKATQTQPAESVTMYIDAAGTITAQRASETTPHTFNPREVTTWNIDFPSVLSAIKQAKRTTPATPTTPASEAQYTPAEPTTPPAPDPIKVNPPPADPPTEPPTGGPDDPGPDDNDPEPIRKPQPKTPPMPKRPAPGKEYQTINRATLKKWIMAGMMQAKCDYKYTDDYYHDAQVNFCKTDYMPARVKLPRQYEEYTNEVGSVLHRCIFDDHKDGYINFDDDDFRYSTGRAYWDKEGTVSFIVMQSESYTLRFTDHPNQEINPPPADPPTPPAPEPEPEPQPEPTPDPEPTQEPAQETPPQETTPEPAHLFDHGHLSRELAYRAHTGTSMSPEKRADSHVKDYAEYMQRLEDQFMQWVTPENRAQISADLQRFQQGYLSRYNAYLSAHGNCISAFIAGPSNFPTRRAEKANARADARLKELVDFPEKVLPKIRAKYDPAYIARAPISSDNPNAVQLLQEKINKAKRLQERMKAANLICRNKKTTEAEKITALGELGITAANARELLKPQWYGVGFAPFELTNNNANIKRMEQRVTELTRKAETPAPDAIEINGVKIEVSKEDNRLRLYFDGKPPADVRDYLKHHGFKWSPTAGAWQRMPSRDAMDHAKHAAGMIK